LTNAQYVTQLYGLDPFRLEAAKLVNFGFKEMAISENASTSLPSILRATGSKRWLVGFVLGCSVLTGYFDRVSIAVLFSNADFYNGIGIGFNMPRLGLLMTSFLIAYGVSSFFLGSLGDLLGPRLTLGLSAAIWGILMVIMGTTSSYAVMIVCRILLGLAEGPQFALLAKIVKRWFPAEEHARANAIWLMGGPLGSAIGFPLTLWLVHSFGWRSSFYVLGFISFLIVMPLVFLVVRDWPDDVQRPEEVSSGRNIGADFGDLARDYRFWLVVLINIGNLVYLWGLTSWLPTYLDKARHLRLTDLGIFASLPFILTFFSEFICGLVSDRIGKRAIIALCALIGAGSLVFLGSQAESPYTAATLIALSSASWGFSIPVTYAMAIAFIPARLTSTGIGVLNGIGNIVSSFVPLLIGMIVAASGGNYGTGLLTIVLLPILLGCAAIPLVKRY
jgi:sugar phosphate permease